MNRNGREKAIALAGKRSAATLSAAFVLLIVSFIFPCLSHAQGKTKTPAKKNEGEASTDEPSRLTSRIADVLRSTAEGAKKWKDERAAARVQAEVADLIWESDPALAHAFLISAWDKASSAKEERRRERSAYRNSSAQTDTRREVMMVARRRAPELAKRWLGEMAEETERQSQERGIFDDRTPRTTVLLEMALAIAPQDAKAAADLATESLQDGISMGLQSVLLAIQQQDFELAQAVFRRALQRLKAVGMVDPNELLILFSYLYTPGMVKAANTSEDRTTFNLAVSQNRGQVKAASQLNPALALEYLKVATEVLLNAPPPAATGEMEKGARAQLSVIAMLYPLLQKQLPEQAAALKQKGLQLESEAKFSPAPAQRPADLPELRPGEKIEEYAERRIDLMEENARRESNPLRRDILFAEAAIATNAARYERGWSVAGNIQDEQLRADLKNWLTYRATLHLLEANDFDRAYQLLSKNSEQAQRAASLVIGAQRLVKSKDLTRARDWLQEAQALLKKAEMDENWTRISLGIVTAYGQFDKWAALDALNDGVKLMGRFPLEASADERAPLIKKFSVKTISDITFGTSGFGWRAAAGVFAPEQFEQVLDVLAKIESPEARGVAIVALCRKLLSKETTPRPQANGN
ncbi:MAG: hypothetical protein ICV60_01840 [Pyrinomonadaceae bacterium]|nr:hypothetical protein [Pyrinomonadaceae bacterium]